MAILSDGDLSFELRYVRIQRGPVSWVYYRFRFLWQGIPIINDAILKRINNYWNDRQEGELLACSDLDDDVLVVLERALSDNQMVEWEPVEPDVSIRLYPNDPFACWGRPPSANIGADRGADRADVVESSVLHRDSASELFTLVVVVAPYQFKGADSYGCGGPGLEMVVRRKALEGFISQLRNEFDALSAQN